MSLIFQQFVADISKLGDWSPLAPEPPLGSQRRPVAQMSALCDIYLYMRDFFDFGWLRVLRIL